MTKHKVVGGTVLCPKAGGQVCKTRLSYLNFCTVLQRGEEGPAFLWTIQRYILIALNKEKHSEHWEILRMAGDDSPQSK
jgi:hypothetical protein